MQWLVLIKQYIFRMNTRRGKKGKGEVLPHFISRLQEMMEDPHIEAIVGWNETRDAINIKNVSLFTDEVLPSYYKHRNFSSFIRQLNMYNFNKIRSSQGDNVYANRYFKAGHRQELRKINRKVREIKQSTEVVGRRDQRSHRKDIQHLQARQKILEQMCKQCVSQNKKLMSENSNLLRKIEEDNREKDRKVEQCLFMLLQQTCPAIASGQLSIQAEGGIKTSPIDALYMKVSQNQIFQQVRASIYGQTNFQRNEEEKMPQEDEDLELDSDGFLSISNFKDINNEELNLEESR